MKKALTKNKELYYYKDEEKIIVTQDNIPEWITGDLSEISGNLDWISGDVSGIRGNVSGISGNVTGIRGYVSGISGNVNGIRGDLTGIRGDVDNCELTEEEREKGININDLIK